MKTDHFESGGEFGRKDLPDVSLGFLVPSTALDRRATPIVDGLKGLSKRVPEVGSERQDTPFEAELLSPIVVGGTAIHDVQEEFLELIVGFLKLVHQED